MNSLYYMRILVLRSFSNNFLSEEIIFQHMFGEITKLMLILETEKLKVWKFLSIHNSYIPMALMYIRPYCGHRNTDQIIRSIRHIYMEALVSACN